MPQQIAYLSGHLNFHEYRTPSGWGYISVSEVVSSTSCSSPAKNGGELNEWAKPFLEAVPDVVKTILGQKHVVATNLRYLPVVCETMRLWGVYVDVAMKYDSDQVEGVYIGSSVAFKAYIGIRGRIEYHLQQSWKAWSKIPAVKDRDITKPSAEQMSSQSSES
jgi:hypothetical protein